ncbi:MAG: Spy/CpxP family protein refolding chaperone [Planctomycetota bacterium]|nr:Spy/CpxP family protein refolding chaperone [Planctomycetota bacterium]
MGGAFLASLALNVVQYQKPTQASTQVKVDPPAQYADLDLSPAQIGVLNRCGIACCDAADELRRDTQTVSDELRIALSAEVMDEKQVKALAAKLCELRNKEVDNNIETLLQVRNTLDPKQVRTLYRVLYPAQEH